MSRALKWELWIEGDEALSSLRWQQIRLSGLSRTDERKRPDSVPRGRTIHWAAAGLAGAVFNSFPSGDLNYAYSDDPVIVPDAGSGRVPSPLQPNPEPAAY